METKDFKELLNIGHKCTVSDTKINITYSIFKTHYYLRNLKIISSTIHAFENSGKVQDLCNFHEPVRDNRFINLSLIMIIGLHNIR